MRKTHDIQELAYQLMEREQLLPYPPEELGKLNPYAVSPCYDDMDIYLLTLEEAGELMWNTLFWSKALLERPSGSRPPILKHKNHETTHA